MPISFITSAVNGCSRPGDIPALNASKCSESIRCINASAIGPCTPLVSDKNKTFHFRRPPILSAAKQASLTRRIHFFVALAQRAKEKERACSGHFEGTGNEPPRLRTVAGSLARSSQFDRVAGNEDVTWLKRHEILP